MNTRVFRLDLNASMDIAVDIATACDKQLADGFKLATIFIWNTDAILVFQKV